VHLGSLTTDDVAVELLHGPVAAGDELSGTEIVRLQLSAPAGSRPEPVRYRGRFGCDQAGRHGYTVRIVPSHPDLAVPIEMGCVAWA